VVEVVVLGVSVVEWGEWVRINLYDTPQFMSVKGQLCATDTGFHFRVTNCDRELGRYLCAASLLEVRPPSLPCRQRASV
jgi:hypothetical protein